MNILAGEEKDSSYYEIISSVKACEICYTQDFENLLSCKSSHYFCQECLLEYIKLKQKNFEICPLACPKYNCSEDIYRLVKEIVDEESWGRFKRLRKIKKHLANPAVK